jgi:hypothetical protein
LSTIVAGRILGSGAGKAVDGSSIGLNDSNELEVLEDGISTSKILIGAVTSEKLEFKLYAARLNQAGTNPPAATVIKNTLGGTPVWYRTGAGLHHAYGANLFPANKTIVFVQADGAVHCGAYQSDSPNPNSSVDLNVRDYLTEALVDGASNISILVLVFP